MKKLHHLLFCFLFIAVFGSSVLAQKQEDELYTLGNSIIAALQNNDKDAFLQAHVTRKDHQELTRKSSRIAASKEKEDLPGEDIFDNMEESYNDNFEEIIQKGISSQINWKEINFYRTENTATQTNEGNLPVIHNPFIVFTYKEEEVKLKVDKIVKLDRGWVVVGNITMQ